MKTEISLNKIVAKLSISVLLIFFKYKQINDKNQFSINFACVSKIDGHIRTFVANIIFRDVRKQEIITCSNISKTLNNCHY